MLTVLKKGTKLVGNLQSDIGILCRVFCQITGWDQRHIELLFLAAFFRSFGGFFSFILKSEEITLRFDFFLRKVLEFDGAVT